MTTDDIRTCAIARGHNMPIIADSAYATLTGWATAGEDFDTRFSMTCDDTGDLLWVNGWHFVTETNHIDQPLRRAA